MRIGTLADQRCGDKAARLNAINPQNDKARMTNGESSPISSSSLVIGHSSFAAALPPGGTLGLTFLS
jgi:hypothetical protein